MTTDGEHVALVATTAPLRGISSKRPDQTREGYELREGGGRGRQVIGARARSNSRLRKEMDRYMS